MSSRPPAISNASEQPRDGQSARTPKIAQNLGASGSTGPAAAPRFAVESARPCFGQPSCTNCPRAWCKYLRRTAIKTRAIVRKKATFSGQ